MSIEIDGSNLRVTRSVRGHVFPRQEAEVVYPVLIDATLGKMPIHIEGSLYGKELRFIGPVEVGGPVVASGDLSIQPDGSTIAFYSGLNASEGISVTIPPAQESMQDGIEKASVVVRG